MSGSDYRFARPQFYLPEVRHVAPDLLAGEHPERAPLVECDAARGGDRRLTNYFVRSRIGEDKTVLACDAEDNDAIVNSQPIRTVLFRDTFKGREGRLFQFHRKGDSRDGNDITVCFEGADLQVIVVEVAFARHEHIRDILRDRPGAGITRQMRAAPEAGIGSKETPAFRVQPDELLAGLPGGGADQEMRGPFAIGRGRALGQVEDIARGAVVGEPGPGAILCFPWRRSGGIDAELVAQGQPVMNQTPNGIRSRRDPFPCQVVHPDVVRAGNALALVVAIPKNGVLPGGQKRFRKNIADAISLCVVNDQSDIARFRQIHCDGKPLCMRRNIAGEQRKQHGKTAFDVRLHSTKIPIRLHCDFAFSAWTSSRGYFPHPNST